MFRFAHPDFLYLLFLLPALVAFYVYAMIVKKKAIKKYGNPTLLAELMPEVSTKRQHLKFWLLFGAITMVIFIIAGPQFGSKLETVKRQGVEIMVCLDVSNSMLAEDVSPNRLDKAKQMLSRLTDGFTNDKVGLIVFAGDAFTQLPITSDYISAKMFLSSINPSMVSTQGTAIGAAINLAARSFTPDETTDKAIILITDGENHEDDAIGAAKAAADVQVLAPGSVRVNLTLRDVELKDLTPAARPDAELQVAFAAAANREFDGLITALYGINGPDADPLDLCFWLQNRYGSTQGVLRAELTLHWHRPGEG